MLSYEHERDSFPSLSFDEMMLRSEWKFNEILTTAADTLGETDLSKILNQDNEVTDAAWDSLDMLFQEDNFKFTKGIKEEQESPFKTCTAHDPDKVIAVESMTRFQEKIFDPDAFLSPVEPKNVTCSPLKNSAAVFNYPQISSDDNPMKLKLSDAKTCKAYEKFIPIKPKVEQAAFLNAPASFQMNQDSVTSCSPCSDMKSNVTVNNHVQIKQKVMKRQQRMVRNRESALHSRRKKKEMMHTLEDKVNALSSINFQLKSENDLLKDKINNLEFENWKLKNQKLIDVPAVAKKTSYALVIFVFLAINSRSLGILSSTTPGSKESYETPGRHARLLLEFKKQSDETSSSLLRHTAYTQHRPLYDSKLTISSLRDRRPVRDSIITERRVTNKKVTNGTMTAFDDADCSSTFNKTEVVRLNEALERLVKGHQMSQQKKEKTNPIQKTFHKLRGLKHSTMTSNCSSSAHQSKNCSTKSKNNTAKQPNKMHYDKRSKRRELVKWNELQVFHHKSNALNLLKKSIDRKPNTFYFMSFKGDHIILPATQINETKRPRFSFILPLSNYSNWNNTHGKISMVQIDCQVMDMKILRISEQNELANYVRRKSD